MTFSSFRHRKNLLTLCKTFLFFQSSRLRVTSGVEEAEEAQEEAVVDGAVEVATRKCDKDFERLLRTIIQL